LLQEVNTMFPTRTVLRHALILASLGFAFSATPAHATPDSVVVAQRGLHLVVNAAANRLEVYESGTLTRTYRASVGLPGYETPLGEHLVNEVIWNPWWYPPSSDWARGRKATPPGAPDNPMGRVKMRFGPLLYIHGTPEEESVGHPASRGCIRMRNEDVMELARTIQRHATPNVASSEIDRLQASSTTLRNFNARTPVRLSVYYAIAEVQDDFLLLWPDFYQRVEDSEREGVVAGVLQRAGVDLDSLNHTRLDELMEKARERRVAVAIEELTRPISPAIPMGMLAPSAKLAPIRTYIPPTITTPVRLAPIHRAAQPTRPRRR
jgi:hypothetical protein